MSSASSRRSEQESAGGAHVQHFGLHEWRRGRCRERDRQHARRNGESVAAEMHAVQQGMQHSGLILVIGVRVGIRGVIVRGVVMVLETRERLPATRIVRELVQLHGHGQHGRDRHAQRQERAEGTAPDARKSSRRGVTHLDPEYPKLPG